MASEARLVLHGKYNKPVSPSPHPHVVVCTQLSNYTVVFYLFIDEITPLSFRVILLLYRMMYKRKFAWRVKVSPCMNVTLRTVSGGECTLEI